MDIFELLYQGKDIPQKTSSFLENFLLFEIYSPIIIRLAHNRWEEIPNYVKESVHPEMRQLIQKADDAYKCFSGTYEAQLNLLKLHKPDEYVPSN